MIRAFLSRLTIVSICRTNDEKVQSNDGILHMSIFFMDDTVVLSKILVDTIIVIYLY